jgi:fluoroacetyl-CoA thioesterase
MEVDNIENKITQGLSITFQKQTTASDAYISNTSSIENLVSTPALLTMIVEASCKMLDSLIPQQYLTVGNRLELSHINPTLVGDTITLILTVEKVDGNKILLDIVGADSNGRICLGKYHKVIVERNKLMENAYKRSKDWQ